MPENLLNDAEPEAAVAAPEAEAPARPDWLPEKYKSPEDLAKAYKELEGKLGSKDEELRKSIKEEVANERLANRPKTSGEYNIPDDVQVENELVGWWAETAFENGFSQEQFEAGIETYRKSMEGSGPDIEGETKKLGENSKDRINAASSFAQTFFPAEALPAIERMCEKADGIIALEAIMNASKGASFSQQGSPVGRATLAELTEMMRDPRYDSARYRDSDFVKKVNDGFKQLYG